MPRAGAVLLLLATACRVVTTVEVETELRATGGATRTVTIHAVNEGERDEPPVLPETLLEPPPGYVLVLDAPDRRVLRAVLADVDAAPPAARFGDAGRSTAHRARHQSQDWGLFTRHLYRETIADPVEPAEVKRTLDELARVSAALTEEAMTALVGETFDHTRLLQRLRGDVREALRDAAFVVWQETQAQGGDLTAVLPRVAALARDLGIGLAPAWPGGEEPDWDAARRAVAVWVEEQLRPREEGMRTNVPSGMEYLLFEGPFAEEWERLAHERFGGAEAFEQWLAARVRRVTGVFGARQDDVVFRLRVRMPGELLRTNGYLVGDGWTFVEFPAHEAFPSGRSLECASVVWDREVLSSLPAPGLLPRNATAVGWMRAAGEGLRGAPDPALTELVRACAAARSLAPLEEAAEDPELGGAFRERARAAAEWLSGRGRR